MSIDSSKIGTEIREIVTKYGNRNANDFDGYIEKDFDITGSDPILMMEEIEKRFNINLIDQLQKPKTFDRRFLEIKVGSVTINHIDDMTVLELIDLVVQKFNAKQDCDEIIENYDDNELKTKKGRHASN